MNIPEWSFTAGEFYINGGKYAGELKYAGYDTLLDLHSRTPLEEYIKDQRDIHGVLKNNERVSLIECINMGEHSSYHSIPDDVYFLNKIFPHYVVVGHKHINGLDKILNSISILFEDSVALFYDTGAFGSLFGSKHDVKGILEENLKPEDAAKIGDHPHLFYYTGKHEILSVETKIGTIKVFNSPTFKGESPKGISVENRIWLRIGFADPVDFHESYNRIFALTRFVETVTGKPQNIDGVLVELPGEVHPVYLKVYASMSPSYRRRERDAHPRDMLINGGLEPEQFSDVIAKWIAVDSDRIESRTQFIESFREDNYTTGRMVATANMFDILPKAAVGDAEPLPPEIAEAIKQARAIFKSLEVSPERESALNALGYISKHNLRTKIKHCANVVQEALGEQLDHIDVLIDEAVYCRNLYVHGTYNGKLTTVGRLALMPYLIDMLEFIFGAFDLIECGWNVKAWNEDALTPHHPFAQFLHGYNQLVKNFQAAQITFAPNLIE